MSLGGRVAIGGACRSLPYVASVYKRRTATLSLVPAHLLRYFVLLYICDIVDPALD